MEFEDIIVVAWRIVVAILRSSWRSCSLATGKEGVDQSLGLVEATLSFYVSTATIHHGKEKLYFCEASQVPKLSTCLQLDLSSSAQTVAIYLSLLKASKIRFWNVNVVALKIKVRSHDFFARRFWSEQTLLQRPSLRQQNHHLSLPSYDKNDQLSRLSNEAIWRMRPSSKLHVRNAGGRRSDTARYSWEVRMKEVLFSTAVIVVISTWKSKSRLFLIANYG